MDEGARFPKLAAKAGHYESFYIKACRAGRRPRALDPPHGPQASRGGAEGLDLVRPLRPRGGRPAGDQGHGAGRPALGARRFVDPGRRRRARPRPRRGLGRHRGARRLLAPRPSPATPSPASTCRPTGSTRRRCRGPSSSPPTPTPASRAGWKSTARIDRVRRLAGDDRPQLGHRARRALGLARGHRLRGLAGTYFDAGAARVKLGRRTSPWIPSGMLVLDGEPHRLGGLGVIRSASIEEAPTVCSFVLPGKDILVRGRVSRPGEGLRRLGLRRPQGPRAQHRQLLGRRPRTDRRAPRPAGPRADPRRRRRL